MSVYIEVEPDRADAFAASDDDKDFIDNQAAPVAEGLRAAYQVRVEAYYRDLVTQLQLEASDGTDVPESAFPVLVRTSDNERIAFDGDLFGLLLDIYMIEGWGSIARLEAQLEEVVHPKRQQGRSGGIKAETWMTAYDFFVFCRNMVAALIAATLADLERRSATRMIAQLSFSATKLADAWKSEFAIKRAEEIIKSQDPGVSDQVIVTYTFGNQALVTTLSSAIQDAVKQRVAFEDLLERISNTRDAIRMLDRKIERSKRRGVQPLKQQVDRRDQLIAAQRQQNDLRTATKDFYDAMKAIIGMNCPWGLLIVDSLSPGFQQSALEDKLGETLWQLFSSLDGLGKGIDPQVSRSAVTLASLHAREGQLIDPYALQKAVLPVGGPEAGVAAMALAALDSGDQGVMPLLHGETWEMLLHRGEIGEDSFEYVVMRHYVDTLNDLIDAYAAREQAAAEFLKIFTKVTAALSIALLITPLAEVAPALRAVSVVADLALMAYTIYSVTGKLSQLDAALDQKLVSADAFAVPGMARIGRLMIARTEYVEHLTTQLMVEFLLIIAAGRWPIVQKGLIVRGFLMDMQIIIGDDGGE